MVSTWRQALPVFVLLTIVVQNPGIAGEGSEKTDPKKFVIPNWPKTCGKQQWDLSAVAEKYTIKSGKVDADAGVVFLIEIKEDAKSLPSYTVDFFDKDGVKMATMLARAVFSPRDEVKKGDIVRLSLDGWPAGKTASGDAQWVRVTKVKLVP